MNDIAIVYDNDNMSGDISLDESKSDLIREEGLTTAVYISLFTDQRVTEDEQLSDSNSTDKRGWWGDQLNADLGPEATDQIGSKLWLKTRASSTTNNVNVIKNYIVEALDWMIRDGVCAKIDVTAEKQGPAWNNILAIQIDITKNDGDVLTIKFDDLWNAQFEGVA